jgi:hypothetical protein
MRCTEETKSVGIAEKVSVLYMSCKKYSDLWIEYFKLFRRYWPACPFKIKILTDMDGPNVDGVEILRSGKDVSWSDNLLFALERIDSPYVLMLLDDFFIMDHVQHDWVMKRIQWAVEHDHNYLRLCSYPPKPVGMAMDDVGPLPKGAHYRNSTRFPLWKRETLRRLVLRGESAWEFEVNGSVRSDEFDGFYAAYTDPFKYANCVIKGKWNPVAVARARRRGVSLDLGIRPYMTILESSRYVLGRCRSMLLSLFPYQSRRSVRRFFHGPGPSR